MSEQVLPLNEYSCLSITRKEFEEIYTGLNPMVYIDLFYTKPEDEKDIFKNFMPSKLWRLNNLYTIVDKYGTRIRFKMNKAQHIVYAASLTHPRLVILKSRQQGISTFWLVSFFDDAVTSKDFSIGLMAQGQDEASTLLVRTKLLWDTLSPIVKSFLNVAIEVNNTKEFKLTNGSQIFVRTSFRSTTLQRLHISEMGKIANKFPEKARETKTGTLQAIAQGNIAVIESTAEGDNLFKSIWDNAVLYSLTMSPKDFKPVFLSWIDDPDCNVVEDQIIIPRNAKYFQDLETELNITLTREQKNFWIVQFRELGEKIYQEYPSTAMEAFMATKEGAYYAALYLEYITTNKREIKDLYDPNLEVQLSVDLGMDDTNVLCPFQTYKDQFRIISEFQDNGQQISYYTDWIKDQPWFENLTHVILPHDAEVNDLTSGKTRTEVFEEELKYDKEGRLTNIVISVLPKTSSINTDIEKVRQIIKSLWIDQLVEYLKYCLLGYTKEWDDRREKWRNKPLHNEASNGADAIRYMVLGANRSTLYISKSRRKNQNSNNRVIPRGFDV